MIKTPAQARSRIEAIKHLLNELPIDRDKKNSPRELLKNGYVHDSLKDRLNALMSEQTMPDHPLTFTELTTWNTWFELHPEKVAGDEEVTTSFHFPIQVKAKKEDIIKIIDTNINAHKSTQNNKSLLKMKLKAKAIKAKLKMKQSGLSGLINENAVLVKSVISKSLQGLSGPGDILTFDQINKEYNQGITEDEIKAWVWYKRKQGEPMKGWSKYYIQEGLKGLGFISTNKQLAGMVVKGLLFYHDGDLMPYPVYAYANMYDRDLQLQKDKQQIIDYFGQECYNNHKKVIDEAKPRLLSIMNPDPRERPKILVFSSFVKNYTIDSLRDSAGVEIEPGTQLRDAFGVWLKNLPQSNFDNVGAYDIWNYYVLGHRMPNRYSDSYKQTIEQYGPIEGEKLFSRFLYEALPVDDQQKLDFSWNRVYNGWSSVPYHRIPIGFECSARFKKFNFQFSPIQREGVAFMGSVGSGIIAYDVGVGKTITAIITLANDLYSGKCKRPVIVVPNATYGKWIKEIFGFEDEETKDHIPGVLSYTKVKLNDWYNLGTKILEKIDLENPVPENSITMLTYEGLQKLGYSPELMGELFQEFAEILTQETDDNASKRDLEKKYQSLRELIGTGNKGTVVDIDKMMFDYIVIDEAHNFRNVLSYVPADEEGNKRFKIQSSESARAQKAFFVCNYIQRKYGSNVMLLTATPFTNNPVEIYSMTSLVGHKTMVEMGLKNLYEFMSMFILQSFEYVNNYDGTIVQKHVVKAFNNRLILQKLIFNHINYKTGEEAGVRRPCKINLPKTTYIDQETGAIKKLPPSKQITTYLEMNEDQEMNQAEINRLAKSGGTSAERMKYIMKALAGSLDNALSPFLYDKLWPESPQQFIDKSPKIKYVCECIRSVKEHHEANGEPVSGQVIYSNRGKEYFKYIKEYLEDELGYKRGVKYQNSKVDEVEILVSGIKQEVKEKIKDAFLDGVCKIIIGTSTIREGIDLQKNGSVLYNMYPDWNPTDVKQLEGRIWRQGNNFGYVRIVMPLVQNSMDVFVFQKLEEKTSRLNDIWYRADRGNVLDVESLDPEEVKFALFTDLGELSKIVIEKEERELRKKKMILEEDMSAVKSLNYSIVNMREYRTKCIGYIDEWKNTLKEFPNQIAYYGERWQVSPAQMMEYEDRSKELVKMIEQFQESSEQSNKDLLAIGKAVRNSTFGLRWVIQTYNYNWDMFKQYMLEVAKAETTILAQKGYTLQSDFEQIKTDIQREIDNISAQIKYVNSPENKASIMRDIAIKKEANKVEGRIPQMAMEDFANLNYLLDYKFGDIEPDQCELPEPKQQKTVKSSLKMKLKLKAKAIKIKFELMKKLDEELVDLEAIR